MYQRHGSSGSSNKKIYEFVNKEFVKIVNPRYLVLCDYNVGKVDTLVPKETPTTYAKLLHNDVSSGIKKLRDEFHGSDLITNLFTQNNDDTKATKLLFFEVEDKDCFHNCINFTSYFDSLTFDDRVTLVHGMTRFLEYVTPNKNNEIVEFIEHLSDKLIQKKTDFKEYITKYFENLNIYPRIESDKIWYFMKCLCHIYIFLSTFYNNDQGINRTVRCLLKSFRDYKWSNYFNLSMIIHVKCQVRKDKKWTEFKKHVDNRSEKEIRHQLMSIFIAFCTQFFQGE